MNKTRKEAGKNCIQIVRQSSNESRDTYRWRSGR